MKPLDRPECAPLLIHYHIFKNAGTSFKESVTQAPGEKALSYYDSFNPRGFVPAARSGEICQASSGSLFVGNSCFDTRPCRAMTQAYGYNEVGMGLRDIKQFGNDYNRNRVGPAKLQAQGEYAEHLQVSTGIKNRLTGLADDPDLPDTTRRAARQYLAR